MKIQTEEMVEHPFLRNFPPEHLATMLANAVEMEFTPGEIILKKGDPANRFFLIESGKVKIEAGESKESIQTLSDGEPLGWSWLFPPFSWHYTARAVEPTRCTVLNGGHLLVTAEENHEFGYELMRRVAQVVITRLQAARKKMLEASARNRP